MAAAVASAPRATRVIRELVTDSTVLAAVDTLEATIAGLVAADSVKDASHEAEKAALRAEIGDLRLFIAADARADSLAVEVEQALHARIRELEREKWQERAVAGVIGAGLCLVLCS